MSEVRWVLLDTDVWSELYARARSDRDPRVERWRQLLAGASVAIATQSRAEVLAGLAIRNVGVRKRERIVKQLDATNTAPVNEDVVVAYADLTAECKAAGHALHAKEHTGDRWIAATAIATRIPLLSSDGIYENAPRLVLEANRG